MKNIGALWKNTSSKGLPYLSGLIEVNGQKIPIIVFSNSDKPEGSKQPDFRIFPQTQKNNIYPQSE